MTIIEDGVPKYNRIKPGPSFWEAWEKVEERLTKKAADKKNGVPVKKAKSAKELKEELAKWSSTGFRKLCTYHGGDSAALDGLVDFDKIAYYAEVVAKHNPDAWAEVVADAEGIIRLQIETETKAI